LNTLQVVTYKPGVGGSWLSVSQAEDHDYYENEYLPKLCNAHDHQNELPWFRGSAYTRAGDPDSSYTQATVPAGLAKQLAQAQEVMRIRLRLPTTPPTPCTNGCSRSGNEQMRYMSLSFLSQSGNTLASVADGDFVTTASGYATLIVGTGATIPGWVSVANGYTYLDLTADSGYQNLSGMSLRDILPASTFMCGGDIVPFRTAAASPAGGFMGDDLPVVDYPLAVSLPRTAAPLMGPNACAVFPNGQPDVVPACGVQPSGPIQIVSANTQCPASGCTQIAAQAQPPLTINGSGFGSFPEGLPYNGNSNYLEIIDSTQNWDAGYGNGPCTVSIGEWSTTTISVVANLNVNGACPLLAGDQLTIKVWNPQSPGTPATYTTTVAAN
jgi:hypothetical protein